MKDFDPPLKRVQNPHALYSYVRKPVESESIYSGLKVNTLGWSYLAEQFHQIKRSLAEQFR